ncbi:MAG: hypothetical protein VXZ84_07210 [Planctomycetota bacterium]|nr:hypothetical protein [Planctomycetota bacterium]
MHRTLTFFGTSLGLLVLITLVAASTSRAQNKTARNVRSDAQRDVNKKESTGGLWSSASKLRQRFLPFTLDKDARKDGPAEQARQADATSGRRQKAKRSEQAVAKETSRGAERSSSVLQSSTGGRSEGSRRMVTMPAISVPPAASRPGTDPAERSPRGNAGGSKTLGKPGATPVPSNVSKRSLPVSKARQPIATADLREGKSSRRRNRLSHVDTNPTPEVRIGRVASSPAKLSGTSAQVVPDKSTAVSGEVRASDRQADARVPGLATAGRAQSVKAFSRGRNESDGQPKTDALPRKGVPARTTIGNSTVANPVRQASTTSVAAETRDDRTRKQPVSSSRTNPLSGRVTTHAGARAEAEKNKSKADLPQRVSARLTSQTVGGELGDSLLFTKSPQLSVETLGPSEVVIGKEATFKVRLRNLGDPVAESVLVRINTPLGAQIVAAQPSRGQTNSVATSKQKPLEWRLERLDSHQTEFLNLRIVPRKSDAFDLGVTWTLAPIASQARIKVQEPKLNLEIIGPHEIDYGDTKIYRLTISNPGNGVADNVQLKLKPLDGSSRPMAVRDLGSLGPGGKQVMEVELTARQNGYLNVEAQAIADTDLKAAARQRVLVRRAQLGIDADGPEMNYAGTTATYRFKVDNQGNSSAKNIRVVATLPTGADYLDSSDQGEWTPESRQVVWSVPALVAQNNQTFEVRVSLSHPGENLFNVRLSADDDLAASSEVATLVEALADLQLVINDPRGPVPVDEETTYEVLISNRGTKAAEAVDVVVFFSEGIEPISVAGGSATVNPGQVIFHPIDQIAPGDDVVYKIAARANRSGNHVFRTEVACEESDVRLVAEESTRFYGAHAVQRQARKDNETPAAGSGDSDDAADEIPEYRRQKS